MTEMTTTAAIALIDRELAKRQTTYAKIIARKTKAATKEALPALHLSKTNHARNRPARAGRVGGVG